MRSPMPARLCSSWGMGVEDEVADGLEVPGRRSGYLGLTGAGEGGVARVPDQCGEDRPVGPVQPGPWTSPAQHGNLVPQLLTCEGIAADME